MDRHHQIVVVDRRDDGPQGRWLDIGHVAQRHQPAAGRRCMGDRLRRL